MDNFCLRKTQLDLVVNRSQKHIVHFRTVRFLFRRDIEHCCSSIYSILETLRSTTRQLDNATFAGFPLRDFFRAKRYSIVKFEQIFNRSSRELVTQKKKISMSRSGKPPLHAPMSPICIATVLRSTWAGHEQTKSALRAWYVTHDDLPRNDYCDTNR